MKTIPFFFDNSIFKLRFFYVEWGEGHKLQNNFLIPQVSGITVPEFNI